MVKIIKSGIVKHIKTCENCDCEFSYEAEDVTRNTVWDDHGGPHPVAFFRQINCPFCNKKLNLHEDFTNDEMEKMNQINMRVR